MQAKPWKPQLASEVSEGSVTSKWLSRHQDKRNLSFVKASVGMEIRLRTG